VVVVEGATLATFVTGTITMLIIGVLLNIVGLGIFCWALFALATHALPFFVGMTVGIYSFQVGAGPFGAIVVGFVAGSTTFVAGQFAFSVARSPIVRLVVGLLFALPAARAGYDVTLAFALIGVPSEWWREAFAVVGAITVGGTAWARMSIVRNPALRSGVAPVPPQPPMGAAATSRRFRGSIVCLFRIGAVSLLQHDGDLVAPRALRWRWVISTGDFDPAVARPCVGFGLFRR
jgi:hypothetical protein